MGKAQVRMFESIGAMLVFFMLLVFGFTFYSRMQEASLYSKIEELKQLRIIELAEKIKNLPELQCTSNAVLQHDCFDLIKVEKLYEFLNKPENLEIKNTDYFDLIGYGNISIEEVYPRTLSYQIYERQSKQEKGSPVRRKIFMPIALYNAPVKQTHFGVLVVESYE